MTELRSIPSHSPDIVTRKTGSEYILVPVIDNIADMDNFYTLNETGAFIWELMDGERNVKEIIRALVAEYDIDDKTAKADVISFIAELKDYLVIKYK